MLAKADTVDIISLDMSKRCAKGWQNMTGKKDILELLEGNNLTAKEIADRLELPIRSVYRYTNELVIDGLILKLDKVVKGRSVTIYSLPEITPGVCSWEQHKQILLSSKLYTKSILELDFWPSFKQEMSNLRERKETLDLLITGLKGVGKSVTAIWLAAQLDNNFEISRNLIFRKEQLLRLAIDQPEGMSLVLDDLGTSLSSRAWAEQEREAIFSFFEICRQNRIDLIGTSPSLDLVDLNFRRLIRYVWDIQLRCGGDNGHIHIVEHRNVNPGLKPAFRPVGITDLPYDGSIDTLIQEYEKVKREQLRGAAQDSLEKLQRGKQKVREYVETHPVSSITSNVLMSGLQSAGLNGNLSKPDKDSLQVEMYNTLQDKKQRQKKQKVIQVQQGKENLQKARLLASYRNKYQSYVDKGRSEQYSKTLTYRLIYERSRAGNLKNLEGVVGSLMNKVKPSLVEDLVLARLDDTSLVRDLRSLRDILGLFKAFDQSFYSKVFNFIIFDPEKALQFIQQTKLMRRDSEYHYHKKFSLKRWREGVVVALAKVEQSERWTNALTSVVPLVGATIGLVARKPGWVNSALAYEKRKFWGDI
jgi:DNA polymerase III delta prime subunit